MSDPEKQCRICLDGVDAEKELGRLIRPCLCRGSISYVHVQCLDKWRKTSQSTSAFFACPQCKYKYRFARTRIAGLATNPIIVGGISGLLFTMIVMIASYITTFFMSTFEQPRYYSFYSFYPYEVAQDLVAAAFRVLRDGQLDVFDESTFVSRNRGSSVPLKPRPPPGIVRRFIRRFIIGLPLVGASSVVQMFISAHYLIPVQWLARWRGSRNRRNRNSQDIAALIIVGLLIVGSLRALYKVYQFTQKLTQRVLLRAEDAILEVNA